MIPLPVRRFEIRVIARARHRGIGLAPNGTLVVRVTEPPEGGRANQAVLTLLAKHFCVPRRAITIVQGMANRNKLVEITP